jgi:hypothetical protein
MARRSAPPETPPGPGGKPQNPALVPLSIRSGANLARLPQIDHDCVLRKLPYCHLWHGCGWSAYDQPVAVWHEERGVHRRCARGWRRHLRALQSLRDRCAAGCQWDHLMLSVPFFQNCSQNNGFTDLAFICTSDRNTDSETNAVKLSLWEESFSSGIQSWRFPLWACGQV